jgi:hypothetical protein
MKRRALLIGSPGIPGTKGYLRDMTKKDLNKIKNYLMSNTGGKWYENEILLIDTNDIEEVKRYINRVRNENNDFVFCAFSGHGWYDGDKFTRVFEIGNDSLYESEFRQLSTKQLMVSDSCAEVYKETLSTESMQFRNSYAKDSADNKDYRTIYNNKIIECKPQEINLYSSSVDELSQTDDNLGGHFIHYLLSIGISNEFKNLDVIDTFESAKEKMKKDRRNQTPSSSFPKSASNFLPFSLGKYA